ncbi:glutamate racemase [Patescibacteria group bacterium]|nr:MAG: glutamate racemase [Patescibacteria group bacterium]
MLGIFDSGFGGLTVLKDIHRRLPSLSTVYLGDNARAPYGTRPQDEIFAFTLEGVRALFGMGCPLVILACNTASTNALRRIQQEILPTEFPDRRVLGVIRPTVERIGAAERVGVFATPATVASGAYERELGGPVPQIDCPGLVDMIEQGRDRTQDADEMVAGFCEEMMALDPRLETALLGCTHYPLVEGLFKKHLPEDVRILGQGPIVADALADYLDRHPDISARIRTDGERTYLTTANSVDDSLASRFYGKPISFTPTS